MNKEVLILSLENRIKKLSSSPVINKNLINKTKRRLRALQNS